MALAPHSPDLVPTPPTPSPAVPRGRWARVRLLAAPLVLVVALALVAAACAPRGGTGSYTGDVVAAVNQDRGAAGLPPLASDGQLGAYAQSWAQHIAATQQMVHTDLGALIRLPYMAGWRALGENLFMSTGTPSAGAVEGAWMASSGHRANILNGGYNRIGVGTARDSSGRLWVVAEFGAR
jgi:uncharacterized protein YkwD